MAAQNRNSTQLTAGLDLATQEAIGSRLETMFHTAAAIHNMAAQVVAAGGRDRQSDAMLWSIQELSQGLARELELSAERLQGEQLGNYASLFDDVQHVDEPKHHNLTVVA